jgi:hypothetical protein
VLALLAALGVSGVFAGAAPFVLKIVIAALIALAIRREDALEVVAALVRNQPVRLD